MKYLKIIFSLLIVIFLIKIALFTVAYLIIEKPWQNERVSLKESIAELQSKQNLETLYKDKLTEAVTNKNPTICNELPTRANSYERDKDGKIVYIFLSTSGGPTGPHKLYALLQKQCRIAYALTYLDAQSCLADIFNEIEKGVCISKVAQEMRANNKSDIDKICSLIPEQHAYSLEDCLNPTNNQGEKIRFSEKIEWET